MSAASDAAPELSRLTATLDSAVERGTNEPTQ